MKETKTRIHFTRNDLITLFIVTFSALIYSLGMNFLVKPANLFPGGYGGVARLVSEVLLKYAHVNVSFSIIYFLLNLITVLVVWRQIGPKFMIFSFIFVTYSSLFTAVIPVHVVTEDILLASVFGGVISGIATGLVLRSNASSGGTDFIAIWMSTKFNKPTWNYVMVGNAVILSVAGLLFGWDKALYSIIYQFVSTQIVSLMHQRYKYSRIDIITNRPEEIRNLILLTSRHGITKVACEGMYTHKEHSMLIITVNTYQLQNVIKAIQQADPAAFITICTVDRIIGNYHQVPLE